MLNKIKTTTSAVVLSALLASPAAFADFDKYVKDLKKSGKKENIDLIVAIDYTSSNEDTGEKSYRVPNLHNLVGANDNPYQQTLKAIGSTLFQIDGNHSVPIWGFGDSVTGATGYFIMDEKCGSAEEALDVYRKVTPTLTLSGPTNFAPVIRGAIESYKQDGKLKVLLIITDGAVAGEARYANKTVFSDRDTKNAIVEASNYPISIIAVGVGDGPFDSLEAYDDDMKKEGSKFDNFQFVKYTKYLSTFKKTLDAKGLAAKALKELPEQLQKMKKLGIYN